MKVLLAMLMTSILVFGAACSGGSGEDAGQATGDNGDTGASSEQTSDDQNSDKTKEKENTMSKKQKKQKLLTWEVKLSGMMHSAEQPFNSIQGLTSKDELDKEILKSLVPKASKSYSDFADKLKNMTVPAELPKDMKTKLQAALKDLSAFYAARAEAVKELKGAGSVDELAKKVDALIKETQPKLDSFNDKINALHNKLGLAETDFTSELG